MISQFRAVVGHFGDAFLLLAGHAGAASVVVAMIVYAALEMAIRLDGWGLLPSIAGLRERRSVARVSLAKVLMILRAQQPSVGDAADVEFFEIVGDILENRDVLSMATIKHHRSSTLDHSLIVSQVSYFLALAFGFDAVSTARGALLHDFFLYDWREGIQPHHPTAHPVIALANARRFFALTAIEEDVIVTHMWPVSRTFYAYRESLLVSCVDKIATLWDLGPLLRGIIAKK